MIAEGYSECDFYGVANIWHLNVTSFLLRYSTAFVTRKLICIFSASINYYELARVPKPFRKCESPQLKFEFSTLYAAQVISFFYELHKFRFIMRELQGAILISSLFQTILGFSGLMFLLLRSFLRLL